jgi:hypothetical protein
VHQDTGIRLTGYLGTVRQLVVTGLGRDAPTVIITNDHDLPVKAWISHYARRMTIEQRLAEIIQAFHADALSSAVNLNVDLDIMLSCSPKPSPPPCAPACPATRPSPPARLFTRTPPSRPPPRHPRPLDGETEPFTTNSADTLASNRLRGNLR